MSETVLVVDDSALARCKARGPLEEAGYDVEEAHDGRQALERLDEGGLTCVLLDYEMPDVDGLEVLERMADAGHEVPVVVLTASDDAEVAQQFLQAGASDFLDKDTLMDLRVVNAVRRATVLARPDALAEVPASDRARVLVVDDSHVVRTLVDRLLAEGPTPVELDEAGDVGTALSQIQDRDYDVLLVDHQLPDGEGPEILEALAEGCLQAKTMALTGNLDPDVARRFLHAGAYDVWTKDHECPLRLQVSVDRLVRLNRS